MLESTLLADVGKLEVELDATWHTLGKKLSRHTAEMQSMRADFEQQLRDLEVNRQGSLDDCLATPCWLLHGSQPQPRSLSSSHPPCHAPP